MTNLLSLISYAFAAASIVFSAWYANSLFFGFSFTPSKLEKILKVGVGSKSDIENFKDIGGLNKDSAYYGLSISDANFTYDEKTNKLTGWNLSTSYKTTGLLSAAAPVDVRNALNKACGATDNQWNNNIFLSAFNGNNLECTYLKDGDRYLLNVSYKPTSASEPIPNSVSRESNLQHSEMTTNKSSYTCTDQKLIATALKEHEDFYGNVQSTINCSINNKSTAISLICQNENLRSLELLDTRAAVYEYENATKTEVSRTGSQIAQLITNRDQCSSEECLCKMFKTALHENVGGSWSPFVGSEIKEQVANNTQSTANSSVQSISDNSDGDSCVTEKLRIYSLRLNAQKKRNENATNSLPANQVNLVFDEIKRTTMESCKAEKDAVTTGIPSFDCSKANQRIDQLICSNKELAALDVKLSNSFKSVRYFSKNKDAFLADTREWLAKRQECQDASCLMGMYKNRLTQLQKIVE